MTGMPPLFISLGPEGAIIAVLLGIGLILFVVLQISTGVMALRMGLQRRFWRAAIWGLVCFMMVGAVPLWKAVQLYTKEAAMERLRIERDVPDLTDKTVLYIPARGLDDAALSCVELVEISGASVVYLAERWEGIGQPAGAEPVDAHAPVNLLALIKGTARIEQLSFGKRCVLAPGAAPEAIDYVLLENKYEDMIRPFAQYLGANGVDDPWVNMAFFIGAPQDARAFVFSPQTARLALFETHADRVRFPLWILDYGRSEPVPRDWRQFRRVIRQVVCREPADATEPACHPFR